MMINNSFFRHIKPFFIQSSSIFLILLSVADVMFLVLNCFFIWNLLERIAFDITSESSFASFFLYVQELWSAILMALLFWKSKEKAYLSWLVLLIYIFIDDSMQIHETMGEILAKKLNLIGIFGISGTDFGEILFFAIAGIVMISLILYSFKKGSRLFRSLTLDLFLFLFPTSLFWHCARCCPCHFQDNQFKLQY